MSGLLQTSLPTSLKSDLAASAFALQGEYGAVTQLAKRFKVSRPTVYTAGAEAQEVLDAHYLAKEEGVSFVHVDDAQLKRAIVALRVVGKNSIRSIVALLPILFAGLRLSYGTIQSIAAQAERRAAAFNRTADLSGIHAMALDEMFSQGDPVLAGVCLRSGYLAGLLLEEKRGGDEWTAFLQQGKDQNLALGIVVKDAAKGIAKGVSTVFPEADQRDDSFHALYEMGKVLHLLESKAYGAIARELEAKVEREMVRKTGKGNLRKAANQLMWARKRCAEAIVLHDAFESAMRDVAEAMTFVDLETAQIRTPSQMEDSITTAAEQMLALDHRKCRRVGTYVRNRAPGLAAYMVTVGAEFTVLAEEYGDDAVRVAAAAWRLNDDLKNGRRRWDRRATQQTLEASLCLLDGLAGSKADEVLAAVDSTMERRYRASSAIEGFNAALRPFLYVHKGVTQGFLELFRAYYNLKTRQWGRHKGTSAHECLTGEPVGDWLTMLGYPPSQKLH